MPCAHPVELYGNFYFKYFVADMVNLCVSIPETISILSSAGIHAETSCHSHHRQIRKHAVQIHYNKSINQGHGRIGMVV